jgi:pimeloyl-ACP methyl ester carboxylesterase
VEKSITDNGRSLFYRDEGLGPPVLLVHGFAEDGAIWDELITPLTPGYRLLIPDLPGSGHSQPHKGEVSMEMLAADLKTLLDHEDIDKCVIIGHSMGGYVTLAFAARYPERLAAFGFFHSTAYADSEEKIAARRKSIAFIKQQGAAPFIRQSLPHLFAAGTRQNRPQLIEDLIRRYENFSPETLIQYYEAMIGRPDRVAVLREFAGPILFIIGEHDPAVPMEQALEQCHLPAVSHVHILKHSGHMGMLEEPAKGTDILYSFLNFVSQP